MNFQSNRYRYFNPPITATFFTIIFLFVNNSNIKKANSIQLDIHLPIVANKTSCIYQTAVEASQQLNEFSLSKHTNEKIHFQYFDDDIVDNPTSTVQIPHITLFLTEFVLEEEEEVHMMIANGTSTSTRTRTRTKKKMNQTLLDELIHAVQISIQEEVNKQNKCYYNTQIEKPIVNSAYAMYQTVIDSETQNLSNRIVNMTQKFVMKNQSIPDWIFNIPDEKIKAKKIEYIQMYGSPNVYDEFDPHVTVGYDDGGKDDNENEIEDDRRFILNNLDWETCGGWIDEVRIGLVGDYGTVIGEPLAIFKLENMIECHNNYESNSIVDATSSISEKQ